MLKSRGLSCKWTLWVALLVLSALAAGCGGGNGGTDSSAAGGGASVARGDRSFAKDTKNKDIVTFGEEATPAERAAVSAVLAENLKARAAAHFAAQCGSLGKAGLEVVVGPDANLSTARAECPEVLKKLAEPLKETKAIRADTLAGSIAALRIEGAKAYALFHGTDGHDYAMPMEKEDGRWRVGAIVMVPLD